MERTANIAVKNIRVRGEGLFRRQELLQSTTWGRTVCCAFLGLGQRSLRIRLDFRTEPRNRSKKRRNPLTGITSRRLLNTVIFSGGLVYSYLYPNISLFNALRCTKLYFLF